MARIMRFCFDVQCPFAYMASRRVKELVAASEGQYSLEWFPVLLGGLYRNTQAPQGKDGSASDVMAPNKRNVTSRDMAREAARWSVPLNWNPLHPIRSVRAMRMILCCPPWQRGDCAEYLYRLYWVDGANIDDDNVLQDVARRFGVASLESIQQENVKKQLEQNTRWASDRGAFGVPSFFLSDRDGWFCFGQDRTHFVAEAMGVPRTHKLGSPLRLTRDGQRPPSAPRPTLSYFHDFSSPWSYIASTQVRRIAAKRDAVLRYVPILLGAVFKAIGTPIVPMNVLSPAKREYGMKDMQQWMAWHDIPLRFPSTFPLRTVLPLRVSIADPSTVDVIYRAAWVDDHNIGDADTLIALLQRAGYSNAEELVRKASSADIKEQLKKNTQLAIDTGLCGVPSFQVGDCDEVVWGQDRLSVVEDLLEGWMPSPPSRL